MMFVMFSVILYQPEIPPNTGNIIRLCANTGTALHLIRPLGFELEERRLRRAGLDYHEFAEVAAHDSLGGCLQVLGNPRVWAFSTKAARRYDEVAYEPGDALLFGPETRGLPQAYLSARSPDSCLRLPMRPSSRSLNLANTVAVAVYEAWRQVRFQGGR